MNVKRFEGRSEQAKAATLRWADARRLRDTGGWAGAMYMAGYAVECKLKCKLMERFNCWNLSTLEQELSARSDKPVSLRTHSLDFLLSWFDNELDKSTRVAKSLVCKWRVDWRYNPDEGNETDCLNFLKATFELNRYIDGSLY